MSDHVRHNRAFWDADADNYQAAHGAALADAPLAWGAYRVPESELNVLGDVGGLDVLELGCGAAQWSIALAARGARAFGLDLSRGQLAHARRGAAGLPLVQASGEQVPFAGASFDVVFCDHGALSFCDPDVIVAECARLLRPGGLLAFCCSHPLLYLTWDDSREQQTRKLQIAYDELGCMVLDEGTIDWVLPPSGWVRVLRANGFEIDDLVELCASAGASTTYDEFAPPKWAKRWPAEWIWKARRRAART
ncbi:MAG TPA: class I SAM-dependent methyltransferase [Acidimicrobiia bacterium]|nr:class I SAM-dependent methyltransferase [Acidimicrobiia bacterium]